MKTVLTTICFLTTPLSVMAQQNNGQGEQIDLIYGRSTAGSPSR